MAQTHVENKYGPASTGGSQYNLQPTQVVVGRGDPAFDAMIGKPISRKWDILLVIGVLFIVPPAMQVTQFLLVGDWDFWGDWKDRQWWPTITPPVNIIVPSALQFIAWNALRLPLGATTGVLLLIVGQLIARMFEWTGWGYMPMNFVWPANMIPAGVVLDVILFLSRSYVITGFFGALTFGLMFQPMNSVLFSQYWQPVVFHGTTLTVADVMSFSYPRNQTPNYLRIVEQGKFRAFLSQISYVVALFSGMLCMVGYWIGQWVGRNIAIKPALIYMKGGSGARDLDEVASSSAEARAL